MNLAGKKALVTGGARRIGRAICLGMAARGARVAVHCKSSLVEAREVAAQCPGGVVLEADLADAAECARLVPAAREQLGGLDVLVNNASVYEEMALDDVDEESWERALAVNARAPFFLAREAGRGMREAGGGVIVNVTDAALERPYPRYLPYFAAKAALEAVTRGLARELAPEVRVNAVAPGPVLLAEDTDAEYEAAVVRAVPLGRLGGADAIVDAVLFLIGNDFVTGQTVRVDGGRSLR